MSVIIGLNAYHPDSSAALIVDGTVVAAVEEERFARRKHWSGFPARSIGWCLDDAGLTLADVDAIATNSDGRANRGEKLRYALSGMAKPGLLLEKLRQRRHRASVEQDLKRHDLRGFRGHVVPVEHHLAHLASAFYTSGWERAAAVSIDGFGDFSSAMWGLADRDSGIDIQGRVGFPHSLGVLYQAVTQFLGFEHYGDEYKVMGLAPYGERSYLEAMRELVQLHDDGSFALNLDYFTHHRNPAGFSAQEGQPSFSRMWSPKLESLLGRARQVGEKLEKRHEDIAASLQGLFEECGVHLLNAVHRQSPESRLVLAGGCGMNSVANGKWHRLTLFDEVYIQPAAYDAGGALGAALWVSAKLGEIADTVPGHYLGPQYDTDYIRGRVQWAVPRLEAQQCEITEFERFGELCDQVAGDIADGRVIGWFQGRLEWGARALGNRSILGDPRRAEMKQILNEKIKLRESFRPFAPSILRDQVAEWFEEDLDVPQMMKVLPVRPDRYEQIPAVTHVDGSGRLQTVNEVDNPRYYALINTFFDKTGVPMVLNTSFNENEPIVNTPDEALDCFLRTRMDVLVLGDIVIRRP